LNFYLNYARFKPEEVQYGTREEVLKRKQTENLLVSTPIDMAVGHVTSKIPVKKITSSKFKNPVTRTTTTESRATRKGATVLEEGPESIGNINNRTHSSLNNLHRSTGKKSYTLNSEKSNWKFKPEIPKTAVKNSDGTYSLIKDNNWNFSKDYIQSYENIVTAEPKIYDVTTNSYKLPNIYTGLSSVNTNNIPLKNSSISMSYASEYGQVINTPSSLTPKMREVLNNGDSSGKIKEKIIKNTFNRDPRYKIHDGTYGNGKHGFDVVLEDKVDNTVWIIDSKPIKEPKRFNIGSTRVSNDGAGNTRQLSPNWIDTVVNGKLGRENPTSKLILEAIDEERLQTGIMGINKNPNTGESELILIPVKIKNKK